MSSSMNALATGRTVQLLIDGEWTPSESGSSTTEICRLTGEHVATVVAASVADVRRAVDSAEAASATWGTASPARRREVLQRAADLLAERSAQISAVMSAEMGAALGWCNFNVHVAVGMLREAAAQTYSMIGEVIPSDVPGLTALAVREPAGVVVGIAPWNAPLILGVRAVAMPLAYGNTVVLKASEETPCTHAAIVEALHDAGIPAGAINLITNAPEDAPAVVDSLIAHPAVRRLNFTGSTKVGRIIAEKAGKHLKRVVLELGGKAPMIVLADADIDAAVDAAIFGAFMNQGQICMSTERIVIDREVADEFASKIAERAAALRVGDPADPSTQIGPMVHEQACRHVASLVSDASEHGAHVIAGGGEGDGLFYPPTVLRGVTAQMRLYSEEAFGPVASIIEVDGPEEALRVANDTDYGLSSALFTGDVGRGLELARRIKAGICHINGATVHDEAQMPFGGVHDSGYGRFGSRAALEEFTETRWITVQSGERHYPI
ncbi:aldehyde dehydrogenase [Rhodococcus sp. ABRD24]|uniref:aldehyde dehydrogenase n=1 Tax=Rhodococcus sp. ABRD24 TaxID=2507582 RepID=UPI0010398347|nr:aldehyde dehydrogenase [Rhodococcus sp. ABRD24]QBJ98077.1 aldehyde dehydrogenase [Rhodococcus sp. ABRD24]